MLIQRVVNLIIQINDMKRVFTILFFSIFLFNGAIAQNFEWVSSIPTSNFQFLWAGMDVDSAGNVYYVNHDIDAQVNKFRKLDATGTVQFDWDFTNSLNISRFSVDDSANVYVVGSFNGTENFDMGGGTYNLTSGSFGDIFFAKYDNGGNVKWVNQIALTNYASTYSIDVSNSGNIIFGAYFTGPVDLDPGTGVVNFVPDAVDGSACFAVYDNSGNFLLYKDLDKSPGGYQQIICKYDNNDVIHVAGGFQDTINLNIGGTASLAYSRGGRDIFIASYDNTGDIIWRNTFGGISFFDEVSDFTFDSQDNVYLAGIFEDTLHLSNTPSDTIISRGGKDGCLIQLSPSGSLQTYFAYGTTDDDGILSVSNAGNSIFIAGNVNGMTGFDFDPSANEDIITTTTNDAFVVKFAEGTLSYDWARTWGRSGGVYKNTYADRIIALTDDDFYVGGRFETIVDFDPNTGVTELTPNSVDVYVSKFKACTSVVAEYTYVNNNPNEVTFINNSVNANGWEWIIPNYSPYYTENPVVPYYEYVPQSICLVAFGECTSDTICHMVAASGVGINENEMPEFSIYPNPANDIISIQSNNTAFSNIEIFTLTGEKLISSKTAILDVSSVSQGTYFIRIESEKGIVQYPIIIQH